MMIVRRIALALILVASSLSMARATPGGNQLVTCTALVAEVTANVFAWASGAQSCGSTPTILIPRSTFVAWISNNGSCPGGSTYLLTFGQMAACQSGGGSVETSESANFSGNSTRSNGVSCVGTPGTPSVTTSSAVAPTTSASAISWVGSGNNAAFTVYFTNPSSTIVASYSVPANSVSTYSYYGAGAAAGIYTISESGLASYTCPTIGIGGTAYGTAYWYVP